MPSWKTLINGTLFLFLVVFIAYVGLAIYGVSKGEVQVLDVMTALWSAAMLLLGMVVQSVRDAAAKQVENSQP